MILDIDVGNTRAKWRLLSDSKAVDAGSYDWRQQVLPPLSGAGAMSPSRIRVSNVAGEEFGNSLQQGCQQQWGLSVEFAKSAAQFQGLRSAYREPSRLGVDRWLTLVATREYACDCLVIDAGTAVKLDLLGADGEHKGGFIMPGLKLMSGCLLQATAGIALPSVLPRGGAEPGRDTAAAVSGGSRLAIVGAVQQVLKDCAPLFAQAPLVIITGGNGPWLVEELAGQGLSTQFDTDLVLKGLALFLP